METKQDSKLQDYLNKGGTAAAASDTCSFVSACMEGSLPTKLCHSTTQEPVRAPSSVPGSMAQHEGSLDMILVYTKLPKAPKP